MKFGKYNVPASWPVMSESEKVNYLTNTNQVLNYPRAIAVARKPIPKAQTVPERKETVYWWNKD
jgi:hypothetical protein